MAPEDTQQPTPVTMVELEERLWADHHGEFRAQCDAQLAELETQAAQLMRQGLSPTDYVLTQQIHDGIVAARRVLTTCCRQV